MIKTLYCIRHGFALHNYVFQFVGPKAYTEFRDTPLLDEGVEQAKTLGKNWNKINDVELVVVSPCRRTLETARSIFQNKNVNIIAKDFLIEYPFGGSDICNKRRSKTELQYFYPNIDFSEISENVDWPDSNETVDELNIRIYEMLRWLCKRKEKTIAIISHSSYIGQFKDKKIGDEDNELHHCYPYHIELIYDENKKFISFTEVKSSNKVRQQIR